MSLDADSHNVMNGTKVQLWSPNGNPVQQWALIESNNGKPVKPISNVAQGKKATQSTTAYNCPASNAVNGITTGRYIRVFLDNGTNPLSLGEVQVFGVPIKP